MRGILLYACCLYTLRCILLYRVNVDMVYLLLLEKKLFFVMLPPWCAALGGLAFGHCGGEEGAI